MGKARFTSTQTQDVRCRQRSPHGAHGAARRRAVDGQHRPPRRHLGPPGQGGDLQQVQPRGPRDYNNFNPFERNDEGQMCDKNGCFPGQDAGYMPPNRPDVSWDIQQTNNAKMELLKADPKFSMTGQAGNWKKGWKDNLGPPGLSA